MDSGGSYEEQLTNLDYRFRDEMRIEHSRKAPGNGARPRFLPLATLILFSGAVFWGFWIRYLASQW